MKRGFTLIELLVVIAIIAILAAILFPVFAQAKTAAKKISCLSNVKQMATAAQLYLNDFDDNYPVNNVSYASGFTFNNTAYWYFGLVLQSNSAAILDPKAGLLYPYQKSGPIVSCPDGTNLKPSSGGAPFTIDANGAPLGYDKNVLLVFNQFVSTGVTYGPFPNATTWDDVAQSLLLGDAGFTSPTGAASSSFNGIVLPRPLSGVTPQRCSTMNQQARHNSQSNVAFQDTHAKSVKLFLPPNRISGSNTWRCQTDSQHTGMLLGPGASANYDANGGGTSVTGPANFYFVPDKSSTNPYN